jgi:hypothetical protein
MNRPYTAHSPYSLTPTERIRSPRDEELDSEYPGFDAYEDYDDEYDDEPIDRRWIWIAGVAGAILLVAVICVVVILGGGDSGSVSTTVAPSTTTAQPAATTSAPATTPAAAPPPAAPLPPETVTTLTPSASAPPSAAPTSAAPAPNTVTYQVTGNRQLVDLITVIYTDAQGALQTDLNVALPWSRTVVLDPGVTLSSVTATSVGGQLNCSITDGSGATLAAQSNNSMIATCTR